MNSNSTPNATPQIAPDIFDMERLAKTPATPMEAASPVQDAQKIQAGQAGQTALANLMQKAKPMHFGLAAAAAALIWIGWPYVFSSDATTAQPASRLMLPATADTLASKTSPALSFGASAALQQAASPASETAAAPVLDNQLTQASDPPALPPFAQPMPPAPPSIKPAKPRRKAHHVQTVFHSPHLAKASIGSATSKFSLNTVYTGQAWIEDSERTYVVQVGDTVKGISIISIDARERRVVTSQGVIR